MSRRRFVVPAVALLLLYLAVLVVTVTTRDAHVRPLYDGFAPPPAYSWVDPPAFFASGNVAPASVSAVIPVSPAGSAPSGIATPDGQFVINIGRGAIAPHGADAAVRVTINPLDPKRLGDIPLGLRANGNAYRVDMTYAPSRTAVTAIAKPGSLLIEMPEVGDHLFASPNGDTWSAVPAHGVANRLSLTAEFARPGYYVAATSLPELAGQSSGSSRRGLVLGIVAAALAVVVLLAGCVVRRLRRRG